MTAKIRKLVTFVEETRREMDRDVSPPVRRAAAVAVIANPCAGRYVEDLSELIDIGEELGALLSGRAVAALLSRSRAHSPLPTTPSIASTRTDQRAAVMIFCFRSIVLDLRWQ